MRSVNERPRISTPAPSTKKAAGKFSVQDHCEEQPVRNPGAKRGKKSQLRDIPSCASSTTANSNGNAFSFDKPAATRLNNSAM